MSDPYKYSSPQEEHIHEEIEERYREKARSSYYVSRKSTPAWREYDFSDISNTVLMEVLATYRTMKDIPRDTLKSDDRWPVFEAAKVQYNLLRVFGNTLRYDLLHQRLTRKEKAVEDSSDLRGYVKNREWEGRLPLEAEIWEFARYFAYNPVQDYLYSLRGEAEEDPQNLIDNFTEQVLGITDDLEKLFVRRTLVGAVARALEPGCKFDTVLVLMGPQGVGKSEFFRALFGGDNYGNVYEGGGDKDWRQALHCVWCAELGEIDGHLRQKRSSNMKSFITESTDKFRLPYGKEITAHPRPNILVGTTNDPTPLVDPSGNRRYWVVKTSQRICQKEVEEQRDRVWAAALQIYQQKTEIYYIDYDDSETTSRVEERNKNCREQHPWEETIKLITECLDEAGRFNATKEQAEELTAGKFNLDLCKYGGRYLKTKNILEILGKAEELQTTQQARRVCDAMNNNGFELAARTDKGIKAKVWVPAR